MNKKISFVIMLIAIFAIIFPHIVTANEIVVTDEIVKVADDLKLGDLDQYKGNGEDAPQFIAKVNVIVSVIEAVGIILSVIILIVIGIKYMLGSVEERADYKKTMIPYLIGAFLVFTVSLIPQIIYKFIENF
ncbi:hypothetical protein EGR52_08065 [bacterium]|nr:hypothetical protein [bacterium]